MESTSEYIIHVEVIGKRHVALASTNMEAALNAAHTFGKYSIASIYNLR